MEQAAHLDSLIVVVETVTETALEHFFARCVVERTLSIHGVFVVAITIILRLRIAAFDVAFVSLKWRPWGNGIR
jgi:hypothetical protein